MGKKLKVAVHEFRPLVFKNENGKWTGFEVDLWEKISRDLKIDFDYFEVKTFSSLLKSVKDKKYDVAFAGISRTTQRREFLDMSFLSIDSGLSILSKRGGSSSFLQVLSKIFDRNLLKVLILLLLVVFVYANFYWLIEKGGSVSEGYLIGVFESFWWSIVTFSTVGYGDVYPSSVVGQLFGIFSILSGLAIFGVYIAHLSSSLVVENLESNIKGLKDLYGKRIVTKRGTSSFDFLKSKGLKPRVVKDVVVMKEALRDGEADAVVFDAPVLKDIQKDLGDGYEVSSEIFSHQSYSLVFPKGFNKDLIKKINDRIISYKEGGEYDKLYDKYF